MNTSRTILSVGEVLWDCFEDGRSFGGAPANFACSCAELGGQSVDVSLISSVGRDELGDLARQQLMSHGVNTCYVSAVDQSTGQVFVRLDANKQPSYRFIENPAWDFIRVTKEMLSAALQVEAVCFGSLAQRSVMSRESIRQIVSATKPDAIRLFDINLRAPYWTPDVILDSLALANVLKLNDEELPVLVSLLGINGDVNQQLRTILDRFALRAIALTRGANGSCLINNAGEMFDGPAAAVMVVDPVGAGDAYAAAFVLGLLGNRLLAEIGTFATAVSAYVCTKRGGTMTFPAALQADWQDKDRNRK